MDLISKKELLATTGISYGQLYRWKREKLIPEEWFLKRSSYTGQETFFPREQMLSRIETILQAKDRYSLEELARILSPETASSVVRKGELEKIAEISSEMREAILRQSGQEAFALPQIALFAAVSSAAMSLGLDEPQENRLMERAVSLVSRIQGVNTNCIVFVSEGEPHLVLLPNAGPAEFDGDIEIRQVYSIGETANRLKLKYQNQFFLNA